MADTYIYVIAESERGPVKVGVSDNPDARLSTLQCGNPTRLFIAGKFPLVDRTSAARTEKELHLQFGRYSLCGEWFDLDVLDTINYITGHIKNQAVS